MSRRKVGFIAALVVVVLVVGAVLHHRHAAAPAGGRGAAHGRVAFGAGNQGPVPVTVVPVAREDVPVYLTALGTVQALNTVTVKPQVSGQLMKLDFTEGDSVHKGQVIAEIDPRSFQAQYDQARAHQQQDEAQLASAQSTLKRYQDLIAKHFVSAQDLENQRNTVAQLKATVAADAASARDARVQLDYTRVRAPIDGLAGIRQIDPGNVVSANSTALVVLTQVHPIYVMFTLPEQNLEAVRKAQAQAPLAVAALDREDSHVIDDHGVLKAIGNQIDQSVASFQLKAQFPNHAGALFPGQFVNVRVHLRTVHGALVLPTEAVQRGPDGDYVYVVKADNTVAMQPVTVGDEAGDTHEIISRGLKAGERVVSQGQFRLKPGARVTPMKPGEEPKAPSAAEVRKAAAQEGRHGRRHG